MDLEIKETKNLKEFVEFPYVLFAGHPYWTGELKKDAIKLLSDSHPFWFHSEKKLFIAYRDSKPVGRTAAIINHNHNSFHEDNAGFFGFFECENDKEAAVGLLTAAGAWLKEKGMDKMMGPANPSSNEVWGALLEGFNSQNMIMMPYNPEYYLELYEAAGLSKEKDLLAFKYNTSTVFPERLEKIADRALRGGSVKIDFVNIKKIDESLNELKEIYNEAWEKNWGFVPMTSGEIDHMAKELKPLLKPEYLFFARVENNPAAFCLLLPDFNVALKVLQGRFTLFNFPAFLYKMFFKINRGRMLALGVKKEYRNRGLEMLMIRQSIRNAKKIGWEYGELSWTLEDNDKINSVIEAIGGFVYKKYRIYSKPL